MITPPVSYYVPNEISSPKFAYAFAKGCGGPISDEDRLFAGPVHETDKAPEGEPRSVAMFGSPPVWPLLRRAQAKQRDFFYGDHGYFGRRQFFRVTKNQYQHDGSGHATPNRFSYFGRTVVPWETGGSHVVVCPNSAIYCRLHGFEVDHWLTTVTNTIRAYSDREIRVRWKTTRQPIAYDLRHAWAVVVYSSAAALDALIAGVPVFVLAPFAAGARMGLSDLTKIETPFYPEDREPFLWMLANQQWTLQEIYDGHAWRALQLGVH